MSRVTTTLVLSLLAGLLTCLSAQTATATTGFISTACRSYQYACVGGGYAATAATTGNGWAWAHYGQVATDIRTSTGPHNCTLYVAWRLQQAGMRDPGNWGDASAWGRHLRSDHTPTVGSVAWWSAGHVAYVEQVSADKSQVFVRADNYMYNMGAGFTDSGWISARRPSGFLHPFDLPTTWPAEPTSPRVARTTGSTATLTWGDASNNETSFVSHYKVNGASSWTPGPSVGANTMSMTIGGLASRTSYIFQIGASNSKGTHWSAYASGTTGSSAAAALNYQVTNYDNDGTTGVYLRNSSNINNVNRASGRFVSYGTTVTLLCGTSGSAVGPHANTAWDYVRVSDGRTGWISEHWLNTPVGPNQHVSGERSC